MENQYAKDLFSKQATAYATFRPTYPDSLFKYLSGLPREREALWDCATGNGQAAMGFVPHFNKILATDISEKQISNAPKNAKIHYSIASAEQSGLPAKSIDLSVSA